MGVYYRWKCDEKREYFDPGDILGPKFLTKGYGVKASSIPCSAWVVGALCTDRWYGSAVRLVSDNSDDYDCDGYEEVSQYVLRELIDQAPDSDLMFLVTEAGGDVLLGTEKLPVKERRRLIRFVQRFAREDWPPHCRDEECLMCGERHLGEHNKHEPPHEPFGPVLRLYALGLGKIEMEVEPGSEVSFYAEVQEDYLVERLLFKVDGKGLLLLERVKVGGVVVPTMPGFPILLPELGGLPFSPSIMVKKNSALEVVVKNDSGSRLLVIGGAIGTVLDRKE